MSGGALVRLLLQRGAAMIGILLVLAATIFTLEHFTPADPVHVMLGANASPETIAATKHQLGYDKPLPQQFASYVGDIAHGDLQMSLRTRRSVTTDLANFLPATIELATFGLVLAAVLGTALGLLTALRVRGSGPLRVVLLGLASAPPFLLALLGILLFYRQLGWLPATGRTSLHNVPTGPTKLLVVDGLVHGRFDVVVDALEHLLLPAFCVAIAPAVSIGRVLRSSLVGTLKADYVRTARAKGLRESVVVLRHALRNSRRRRAVDGWVAGRADVRRRRGRGAGVRLARHRALHRPEHPPHRLPCDRRGHARARRRLCDRQHGRRHPAGGRRSSYRHLRPPTLRFPSRAIVCPSHRHHTRPPR